MDENAKKGVCGCLALPVALYLCWIVISLGIFVLSRDSVSAVKAQTLEKMARRLCYPDHEDFIMYPELRLTVPSDVDFKRYMHNAKANGVPTDRRVTTLLSLSKDISEVRHEKIRTKGGLDCVTLHVTFTRGGSGEIRFLVQPKQLWPNVNYAKVIQVYDGWIRTPNEHVVANLPGDALALLTALCSSHLFEK